jgi:hypothetical protein
MAPRRYRLTFAPADPALCNLLAKLLSSNRIHGTFRACPIRWRLLLPRVSPGPFLDLTLRKKSERPVVVSPAQNARPFRRDRIALPRLSTVVYTLQTPTFPLGSVDWTMVCIAIINSRHRAY